MADGACIAVSRSESPFAICYSERASGGFGSVGPISVVRIFPYACLSLFNCLRYWFVPHAELRLFGSRANPNENEDTLSNRREECFLDRECSVRDGGWLGTAAGPLYSYRSTRCTASG